MIGRRSSIRVLGAGLAILMTTVTCAQGDTSTPAPSVAPGGVEELACSVAGHPRFAATYLEGPELDRDAFMATTIGRTMDAFFASPEAAPEAGAYLAADGFSLVTDSYVLGYRDGLPFVDFQLADGRVSSWGECSPNRVDGDLVAARWRPSRPVDRRAGRLAIEVEGGTCGGDTRTEVVRVDVLEDATSVAIVAWTREPEPTGDICAGVGLVIDAVAELEAPLGERSLADGGTVPETPIET